MSQSAFSNYPEGLPGVVVNTQPTAAGQVLTATSTSAANWQTPSGGGGTWGSITGTLSNQTDLQTALNAKLNLTGGTLTGQLTGQTIIPSATATYNLGSSSAYYSYIYASRHYFNSTAYMDGGTAGAVTFTSSADNGFIINSGGDHPTLQLTGSSATSRIFGSFNGASIDFSLNGNLPGNLSYRWSTSGYLIYSQPATSGTTIQQAPYFQWYGRYWNGTASTDTTSNIQHIVDSTTPTYHLSFQVGGTERVKIDQSGLTTFAYAVKINNALTVTNSSGTGITASYGTFTDPASGTSYDAKFGGSNGIAVYGTSLLNGLATFNNGIIQSSATAATILGGTTQTTAGAFVHNPAGSPAYFGIYDSGNSVIYGISRSVPGPSGTVTIGGYYSGLAVASKNNTNSVGSGQPIWGVITHNQGNNGLGDVMWTSYDDGRAYSRWIVQDDGNGNFGQPLMPVVASTMTVGGTTGGSLTTLSTYGIVIVPVDSAGNVGFANNNTSSYYYTLTGSNNAITLSWPSVAGAASYRIYNTGAGNSNFNNYVTTSSTSYTVTSATGGTTGGFATIPVAYQNYFPNSGAAYITSGNLGVGTKTPAYKLDVAGTANMTGFRLPTSPTSGYVLTSDSAGVGTWQAVTGGSGSTVNINVTKIDQTPSSGTYGAISGTVNGTTTLFTVSNGSYVSGSLRVSLNGQELTQGSSYDFVETTPGSGTFTFNTAPASGSIIQASYITQTSSTGLTNHGRTAVADTAYTTLTSDYVIAYTSLTAARTVTISSGVISQGTTTSMREIIIKDESGSATTYNITITPASGTIDGAASKVISASYGVVRLYSNGTNLFTW